MLGSPSSSSRHALVPSSLQQGQDRPAHHRSALEERQEEVLRHSRLDLGLLLKHPLEEGMLEHSLGCGYRLQSWSVCDDLGLRAGVERYDIEER